MRRISPKSKLKAVREVLNKNKTLSEVSSKYKVSRQTLSIWIKKYQKDPKSGSRSLVNGYKRGKNHHRRLSYKLEKQVLDLVIKNPDLGVHIIWKQLTDRGFKVSLKGVYNVLLRYELQTKELRHRFSLEHPVKTIMAQALSPAYRAKIVEQYLKESAKISHVCKTWKVSRPTFYEWLRRYKEGTEGLEDLEGIEGRIIESLRRLYKKGYEHHRAISQETREAILDLVRKRPDYSCHQLYAQLPRIEDRPIAGHHAVQNLLARENLNTQEKRRVFAQGYMVQPEVAPAPEYETAAMPAPSRWRFLYAPFATIPKFVIRTPLTWPLAIPLLILTLYIFEVDKLLRPAMFFPTVALTFGLLFFLYSLKYYYSLIIVLAYPGQSRNDNRQKGADAGKLAKFLDRINLFKIISPTGGQPLAMQPNLDEVKLARYPFVSIHLPLYNEKRVAERILRACREIDYPNFEVIIIDDSTDETTQIIKEFLGDRNGKLRETKGRDGEEVCEFIPNHSQSPAMTLIHRASRAGFKGAALSKALEYSDSRTEYVTVFDADFVPFPDTLAQFVKTFQVLTTNDQRLTTKANANEAALDVSPSALDNPIAAVQGYQWHVLNKSENWVTRGVRTEYAGSYVVERAGIELYGGLKMIAGSVFCIRADILRKFGWGTSITEDLELTLKLYEAGYKIAFTPYIQAPAEAVSTVRRLIRQRMRWAEGHTYNVRKMWKRLFATPNMTKREKFEFLYLGPYYLQAAFFIIGTFSWFIAETVVHAQLPFWTAAWGWSLVFVNLLSLPLMNLVGLFLEESDERDYLGVASFVLLSYILVPFQAYAAVKALFEKEEGPWFRTPKTGLITDVFGKARFYRWIERFRVLGRPAASPITADSAFISAARISADISGNPRVALATAFNPLSGYKISPRRLPYAARSAIIFLLIISLLLNYLAFFPISNEVQADASTPAIEQQINIIDQVATGGGQSFAPTDNSLGLVNWDPTKYDGTVNVNFEAVMKVSGTDGAVGKGTSVYCPSSTDCKIAYYDSSYHALRFVDCADTDCNPATGGFAKTLLDGSSGCVLTSCDTIANVGQYPSIKCNLGANDCRISYYDATNGDLKYADCDAADCSSGTVYTVDSTGDVGQYTSIYAIGNLDIYISYYDVTNTALKQAYGDPALGWELLILDGYTDCVLTSCSTTADRGAFSSIYAIYSTRSQISYYDGTTSDLLFALCNFSGGSACSSGTFAAVDTTGIVGLYTSLDCPVSGLCSISYDDSTNSALKFNQCQNSGCSTANSPQYLDGYSSCVLTGCDTNLGVNTGLYSSISCPTNTNCKISYYDQTNAKLKFAACTNGACSAGNVTTAVATSGSGQWASINCTSAATDCKIAYTRISWGGDLNFYDCNDDQCTTGSGQTPDTGTATAIADLYSSSGTKQNVEIIATGTSYTRVRTSSAISLSSGDYTVRLRGDVGTTASMNAARLIITQTDNTLLTKTETQVEVGDKQSITGTSYATLTNQKQYCYGSTATGTGCTNNASTVWSPTPTAYFEATLGSSSQNVGQYTSIQCFGTAPSTDCKISYYDATNSFLDFIQCTSADCSSYATSQILDANGVRGQEDSIYCSTTTDCKISYGESQDKLSFIQCTAADCSTKSTAQLLDTTAGRFTSIDCSASTDCKIAYSDYNDTMLKFIQCTNADCTSKSTAQSLDTTSQSTGTDIDCLGSAPSTDCKIAYATSYPSLKFIQCKAADCSTTSTAQTLDTTIGSGGFVNVSIYCSATTDCKISYYDATNGDLKFIQCTNADCTSKSTAQSLDTTGNVGQNPSIYCSATTDCKISYYDSTNGDLKFIQCTNADCTSKSTAQSLDTTGNVGQYASIFCSATTDCKISYYDSTNGDLKFIQCTNATCSSRSTPQTIARASISSVASLYTTGGSPVSGSEVSSSDVYTRARSGTITLSGSTQYRVNTKVSPAVISNSTGNIASAKIILDQSDATNGVTALETMQQYNNTQGSVTGSTYTSLNYKNNYTSTNFTGTKAFYFESDILYDDNKGGATTALARLDSGVGEVTTTSATVSRVRSTALVSEPADGNLDAQLKVNTGTADTATSNNSWLVIQITALPVPEIAIFALPGMVFLPKIVSWWKRRGLKRKKQRGMGNDPPRRLAPVVIEAIGNRPVGSRIVGIRQ
ncbi:hypothetical protein A2W70_00230 [Candidatus Curtissbacteria bacterium RIFCSPLOWO2_02_41_11]|uniref:Glycosyltransferase 2-like domain-containing protein n=2 Tax=Candidatus Curtissiibacteriota TaxID=1752717 RepID=A0A1F5HQ87_9BACT|nr:MAG: hypothetical protein UU56_C0005G0022 [Candidatus Curtissbacteria bacterium GW2011_GWA2_41_24]OGE06250.1 MAG: hypothetical protein A2W70_00230 [Candidatus Curtissbacteria bacterium RIFCSPLOWO2_02_41_11]